MIKIEKDLNDIPESLKPAIDKYFILPNIIPSYTRTTHEARMDVINNGAYYKEKKYDNYYKHDDIKEKLNNIYHHKCAFCEQKVEQVNIEHYRPKKKRGKDSYAYYWLAFSWDNLIIACPKCNRNKGNKFGIYGIRAEFVNDDNHISNINTLSSVYDISERPLMVNPEVTNPKDYIKFAQDGKIWSDDERFDYTIKECKINRDYLNDERRKIINDLKDDLIAEISLCSTPDGQSKAIEPVIRKFVRGTQNKLNEFLAFRNHAVKENWIKDILLEITAV